MVLKRTFACFTAYYASVAHAAAGGKNAVASEVADLKDQLAKKTEEAATCEEAKGSAEFNLGQLQQLAQQKLTEAETQIKELEGKLEAEKADAEAKIEKVLAQQNGIVEEIQQKADKKVKDAEKKAKKAGEAASPSPEQAQLAEKYEELKKKYADLKKTADDDADATQRANDELATQIKAAKEEVKMAKKAVADAEKKSEAAEKKSKKMAEGGASPWGGYVDFALVGKLSGVFYKNVLQTHFQNLSAVMDKQGAGLKTNMCQLSQTVGANLKDGASLAYAKTTDLYENSVQPQIEAGLAQGHVLYRVHAAKHLDPLVLTASKTYQSLNVDKHVNTALAAAQNATGDMYTFTVEKAIPQATELLSSKTAVEDLKTFIYQPLTLQVFGEEVKFTNGAWDLLVLLIGGIFLSYFVLYQFVLKFLVYKLLLKVLLYRVVLCFLFRKVVVSLVIGVSWKLLSLAFSTVIFFLKLLMCCGCCGLCFRRSKPTALTPRKLPTKPASPGAVQMTQAGSKKKR
ncbi:unnamed protein product [Amoebophrya sp. A120]|nr:unnamed protein product [Amoebophrya sp. A120]|eukprot:GSA120T00025001001.1